MYPVASLIFHRFFKTHLKKDQFTMVSAIAVLIFTVIALGCVVDCLTLIPTTDNTVTSTETDIVTLPWDFPVMPPDDTVTSIEPTDMTVTPSVDPVTSTLRPDTFKWNSMSAVMADNMWGFAPKGDAANPQCARHSELYKRNLDELTLWAVQMFDSNALDVTGLLDGDKHNLGHFDSCVSVAVPNITLTGQYCLATLHLQWPDTANQTQYGPWSSVWQKFKVDNQDPFVKRSNVFYWGICIPASCGPSAVAEELNKQLVPAFDAFGINATATVEQGNCYIRNTDTYRPGFIIMMCITVVMVLLVVGASIYDATVHQDAEKVKNSGKLANTILCFSTYKNIFNLTKPDPSNNFDVLHGMKTYTMIGYIVAHHFFFCSMGPMNNAGVTDHMLQDIWNIIFLRGMASVDTFFVISSFLATYLMFRELERNQSLPIIKIFILRLLRITPTYMLVVAFHAVVLPHLGDGPVWQSIAGHEAHCCQQNWWTNLLYINNYVNTECFCMIQAWYMAVDMHFFIITPFVILILWNYPKRATMFLATLLVIGTLVPSVIVWYNNYEPMIKVNMRMFQDIRDDLTFRVVHMPTHVRAIPFVIGVAAACIYRRFDCNGVNFSRKTARMCSILGFVAIVMVLLLGWPFQITKTDTEISPVWKGIYISLQKIIWSTIMSGLIVLNATSDLGLVRRALSMPWLVPLGRLSFCAYLVHDMIQAYFVGTMRSSDTALDRTRLFYVGSGITFVTYTLALMFYLGCEGPITNIIKLVMASQRPTQKAETTQLEVSAAPTAAVSELYIPAVAAENTWM